MTHLRAIFHQPPSGIDLLGLAGTTAAMITVDRAFSIGAAVVTIAAMTPLALWRWRRFLRGDPPPYQKPPHRGKTPPL
jgi:hypothetical protein